MKVSLREVKMNKTEAQFQQLLRHDPSVLWAGYAAIKFMVGTDTCYYTPDFVVVTKDEIRVYEVKGFWRDDALVKIKAAADRYRWLRWFAVKKGKNGWEYREFWGQK